MSNPTTLILDMGNVLLRFDPDACIAPYIDDPADRVLVRKVCFDSPEWIMLDAGTISYADALTEWRSHLPARLHERIDEIIANWHRYLPPIEGMVSLVHSLHRAGVPMYLLSNVSCRFSELRKQTDAFDCMKGLVLSWEEKVCKPHPTIYHALLSRYSLTAEDCIFIDDSQANIDGAEAVGIRGIRFDGDADAVKQALGNYGFPTK